MTLRISKTWHWILLLAMLFVPHFFAAFEGFGYTDDGWVFHFGKRLLAGDRIYQDFVMPTPPFAFMVEAALQKVFGSYLVVGRIFAQFIDFLTYAFLFLILRRLVSARFAFVVIAIQFLLPFSTNFHWYTLYARLFLVLSAYSYLRYKEGLRLGLFAAFFFCALSIFSKQNVGVLAAISLLLVASLDQLKSLKPKAIGMAALGLVTGSFVGLLPAIWSNTLRESFQYVFLDARDLKGLTSVKDTLMSVLAPVNDRHYYLAVVLLVVGLVATTFIKKYSRAIGAAFFAWACFQLTLVPTNEITFLGSHNLWMLIFLLAYDFGRILACFFILESVAAFLRGKSVNFSLLVLSIFSLAYTVAEELSWVGRGYSIIFLTFWCVPYFLWKIFFSETTQIQLKRWIPRAAFLIFVICLINALGSRDSYHLPYRDDKLSNLQSTEGFDALNEIRISSQHAASLHEIRKVFEGHCPDDKSMFVACQFPSLYSLLGGQNPTRYDVCFADFLTVRGAQEVTQDLTKHPPKLIVYQPAYMDQPFEGFPKSQAMIGDYLKSHLEHYQKISSVHTALEPIDLYIRKDCTVSR